jgi:hypothetical protein
MTESPTMPLDFTSFSLFDTVFNWLGGNTSAGMQADLAAIASDIGGAGASRASIGRALRRHNG